MLRRHIEEWKYYPEKINIILIDDGSRYKASFIIKKADIKANIKVYRVLKDKKWNQTGARNLGFKVCDNDFCLATDIDHLLPTEEVKHFLDTEYKKGNYYKPIRKRPEYTELRPSKKRHTNTFIIHKEDYWEAGGYDEDFAGHYGSDTAFLNILDSKYNLKLIERPYLLMFSPSHIQDANTDLGRHDSKYSSFKVPELQKKLKSTYKAKNPIRFEWEREI